MRLRSVDLPEPEGPMMDTIWPAGMVSETASRAVTRRLPSNCLETRSRSIMARLCESFHKLSNCQSTRFRLVAKNATDSRHQAVHEGLKWPIVYHRLSHP